LSVQFGVPGVLGSVQVIGGLVARQPELLSAKAFALARRANISANEAVARIIALPLSNAKVPTPYQHIAFSGKAE